MGAPKHVARIWKLDFGGAKPRFRIFLIFDKCWSEIFTAHRERDRFGTLLKTKDFESANLRFHIFLILNESRSDACRTHNEMCRFGTFCKIEFYNYFWFREVTFLDFRDGHIPISMFFLILDESRSEACSAHQQLDRFETPHKNEFLRFFDFRRGQML